MRRAVPTACVGAAPEGHRPLPPPTMTVPHRPPQNFTSPIAQRTSAEGLVQLRQGGRQLPATKKTNSTLQREANASGGTAQNLEMQGDGSLEARWPPVEELVGAAMGPGAGAGLVPVCCDLEATGLARGSRMLQLAAYHPRGYPASFSRYVLPPPGAAMESGAARVTGLALRQDAVGRHLHDVRANCPLPTVSEEAALRDFVAWLNALAGADGGVVLFSHGALLLDVPMLVAAVRNARLEGPFYKVVMGFGDTQAIFQADAAAAGTPPTEYIAQGLDNLYEQIVGMPLGDTHRADVDACHLHELLCCYLRTEELSLRLPALARCAYSARCMRRLTGWRADWCEPNWDALWGAVGCTRRLQRPGRPAPTVKKRRVLVRNLLASGYDLPTLHADWQRGGYALVLRRVTRMKNLRESYITDTRSLTANEVADRVAEYFDSVAARGRTASGGPVSSHTSGAASALRGRKGPRPRPAHHPR